MVGPYENRLLSEIEKHERDTRTIISVKGGRPRGEIATRVFGSSFSYDHHSMSDGTVLTAEEEIKEYEGRVKNAKEKRCIDIDAIGEKIEYLKVKNISLREKDAELRKERGYLAKYIQSLLVAGHTELSEYVSIRRIAIRQIGDEIKEVSEEIDRNNKKIEELLRQ